MTLEDFELGRIAKSHVPDGYEATTFRSDDGENRLWLRLTRTRRYATPINGLDEDPARALHDAIGTVLAMHREAARAEADRLSPAKADALAIDGLTHERNTRDAIAAAEAKAARERPMTTIRFPETLDELAEALRRFGQLATQWADELAPYPTEPDPTPPHGTPRPGGYDELVGVRAARSGRKICQHCGGSGVYVRLAEGIEPHTCAHCLGTGLTGPAWYEDPARRAECTACNGLGYLGDLGSHRNICHPCNGVGYIRTPEYRHD